jgi:hypothetical protein
MGLRDKLGRLEDASRANLESFELVDGSRYYYDPQEVHKGMFLHGIDCLRADGLEEQLEAPEVYRKL